MATNTISGTVSDYSRLKTLPAMLSVLFTIASLYQFGGISQISFNWLDYSLTKQTATFISLGTLLVAFASSETRNFDRYADWEMALIAAGPALIVGYQYIPQIASMVNGSNMTQAGAFLVTMIGWGVAVR